MQASLVLAIVVHVVSSIRIAEGFGRSQLFGVALATFPLALASTLWFRLGPWDMPWRSVLALLVVTSIPFPDARVLQLAVGT